MPPFDPASASVQRNLAQAVILSSQRRGISGAETIGILQKSDRWYSARDYGTDWAWWKDAWQKASGIRYVNLDSRPTDAMYAESRWIQASKYQTVLELRGRDNVTGAAFTQHVTVLHTHDVDGVETYDTSQLMTRRELMELAERYLDQYDLRGKIDIENIVPVMGYRNPQM